MEILKQLRQQDVEQKEAKRKEALRQEQQQQKQQQQEAREQKRQERALRLLARASSANSQVMVWNFWNSASSGTAERMEWRPRGKGPFCRLTCLVHHDAHYDVETDEDLCKANRLDPAALEVPGWIAQGDYEYRQPWPGPANDGFHSYKLYWGN